MPTLQTVPDPIVTELEKIVTSQLVVPCSFVYANLLEANFGLDQMDPQQVKFPVFMLIATGRSKMTRNEANSIIRKATVYGLLLDQVANPTLDYDSKEVSDIVNKMRQLADNMAYYIDRSPMSVNGGVDEWEAVDSFAKSDAHLFGQAVSFTWEIDTHTTGYLNPPNVYPATP
jgi:hypothetical protein